MYLAVSQQDVFIFAIGSTNQQLVVVLIVSIYSFPLVVSVSCSCCMNTAVYIKCKENFKMTHRCHYSLGFFGICKTICSAFSPQEFPANSRSFYFFSPSLFVAGVLLFGFVAILKLCVALFT